jgi:ACS family hexuronate transporter-like MFS transporter
MNAEEYADLESGFSIAFALGTLSAGWLVDKFGVRWIYPIAVAGWSLAGLFTGLVQSYALLFVCRVMLGFFEAGNWPCGIRTIRQVLPKEERSFGNSLFQSGTAIGAIITPLIVLMCLRWADPNESQRLARYAILSGLSTQEAPPESWRWPFVVIGLVGVSWVALWFATVKPQRLVSVESSDPTANTQSSSYKNVVLDRRFLILVLVIIGVNSSWHTMRVWMPKFLQQNAGYSEAEMSYFTMGYYALADVGSWLVGLTTMFLARHSWPLHNARLLTFFACTALVLLALVIPWVGHGLPLAVVLLLFGFGALGLFPTYFALSQDLSATHQGKVTGTLGFINAIYLAGMYKAQGRWIDRTKDFESILAVAGIPAFVALIAVWWFWPVQQIEKK